MFLNMLPSHINHINFSLSIFPIPTLFLWLLSTPPLSDPHHTTHTTIVLFTKSAHLNPSSSTVTGHRFWNIRVKSSQYEGTNDRTLHTDCTSDSLSQLLFSLYILHLVLFPSSLSKHISSPCFNSAPSPPPLPRRLNLAAPLQQSGPSPEKYLQTQPLYWSHPRRWPGGWGRLVGGGQGSGREVVRCVEKWMVSGC